MKQEEALIKYAKESTKWYRITFDNEVLEVDEDDLIRFTKTAVIKNKDVSSYTVERISC